MKAVANGVLNASILDGWWDEAYRDLFSRGEFGWGIDNADAHDTDEGRDARDVCPTLPLLVGWGFSSRRGARPAREVRRRGLSAAYSTRTTRGASGRRSGRPPP